MQLATLLPGVFSLWKGKDTMRFWPGVRGWAQLLSLSSCWHGRRTAQSRCFLHCLGLFLLHFNPALHVHPTPKLLLRLRSFCYILFYFVLFSLPPGEPSLPCRPGASSAPAGRARNCTQRESAAAERPGLAPGSVCCHCRSWCCLFALFIH